MSISYHCEHWELEPSTGYYLCTHLIEIGSAQILVDAVSLAAPFGAGFGIVLVAAASGAGIGLLFKLLK